MPRLTHDPDPRGGHAEDGKSARLSWTSVNQQRLAMYEVPLIVSMVVGKEGAGRIIEEFQELDKSNLCV